MTSFKSQNLFGVRLLKGVALELRFRVVSYWSARFVKIIVIRVTIVGREAMVIPNSYTDRKISSLKSYEIVSIRSFPLGK